MEDMYDIHLYVKNGPLIYQIASHSPRPNSISDQFFWMVCPRLLCQFFKKKQISYFLKIYINILFDFLVGHSLSSTIA